MPTIYRRCASRWWARFRLRSLSYGGQVALPTLRTSPSLRAQRSNPRLRKLRYGCFAALAMTTTCVPNHCRANHLKPVQSFSQKYSAFVLTQIIGITPPVSRQMRGVGHRHERAVRCDGRRWRARRTRLTRTAKSCGSGAAVLALSSREVKLLAGDGGKKAVHREEHEVSRKAIAQGRPECFRCTCMLVCAFFMRKSHARPRVQRAPGLPCAL